jgi:hypothetical protein
LCTVEMIHTKAAVLRLPILRSIFKLIQDYSARIPRQELTGHGQKSEYNLVVGLECIDS